MDQIDNSISNQTAAVARAMRLTRDFKGDYVPCKIEEGLFLGSIRAANNKDALKALNITYILTVAKSLVPSYPNDFVYRLLPVLDVEEEDIKQYFDECYHFIDEAKKMDGRVLVHCFAGISRSVTIVVAFLMKKHRMSLPQALEHVKSKRPCAAPNAGFISQLEDYEKFLRCSGFGAANNKDALKALNITYILTVAKSLVPSYPNDFVYRLLPVLDVEEEDIKQYFDECYHFIDEARKMDGRVLVHCFAGISRSVTIVVAFLMKKHRMSLSQALEHVKSKRPRAAPNVGFISQLEDYEKFLRVHEEKTD